MSVDSILTLFTIPKGFVGHTGVIQRNAIRSWTYLPGCEVILFGEEDGLGEAARDLGVRHVPQIARNEKGTPMVSDAFAQIRHLARTPFVAYVNSDIVFDHSLIQAVQALQGSVLNDWLLVGQRHDLDIRHELAFGEGWQDELRAEVARNGTLHGKAGIDFFVFPRGFVLTLPDFAVGRPGWDSWLIYKTREQGIPLVDATEVVLTVHQNHPPAYRAFGSEALANTRSAGGYYRMGTLRDCDWSLRKGRQDGPRLVSSVLGKLVFMAPVRMLLAARRLARARMALCKWR